LWDPVNPLEDCWDLEDLWITENPNISNIFGFLIGFQKKLCAQLFF
jgi:hypothetical protein